MTTTSGRRVAVAIIVAAASFALTRGSLEQAMWRHMFIQIPALVLAGTVLGGWLPERVVAKLEHVNRGGASGLLAAAIILTYWMFPRALDAAVQDVWIDIAKAISLAFAGCALRLSWAVAPPIARAAIHVEAIATLARFGWGFVAMPERLCLSYRLSEQREVGQVLLVLAAAYGLWKGLQALTGGAAFRRQRAATLR